jgi:histidinol-phosphate aminotransferase
VAVLNAQARELNQARTKLAADLAALAGVEVFPSAANFLLLRVPDADAACAYLLAHKILIKNLSKMNTPMANCIRVTVSTADENAAFLQALTASLN